MEFKFIQNPLSKKWVILAPKRAKRPDMAKGPEPVCPFCLGREKEEQELYRVGGEVGDSSWQIRVVPNKFPFASPHEIIIHSQDHHKNFGELPQDQVQIILQTYRQRYLANKDKGQVYIFHNRGEAAGESLPHPHTQLAVIPFEVKTDIPRLPDLESEKLVLTSHFSIFSPKTSQWPDEVWIAPKAVGRAYGEITDEEIVDLAKTLSSLVQIFNLRHGNEFPYNLYIYPGGDWYLRLIPRVKSLGGFEVGTAIYINTQDPEETIEFIREHLDPPAGRPNEDKIKSEHQAEYSKHV